MEHEDASVAVVLYIAMTDARFNPRRDVRYFSKLWCMRIRSTSIVVRKDVLHSSDGVDFSLYPGRFTGKCKSITGLQNIEK